MNPGSVRINENLRRHQSVTGPEKQVQEHRFGGWIVPDNPFDSESPFTEILTLGR